MFGRKGWCMIFSGFLVSHHDLRLEAASTDPLSDFPETNSKKKIGYQEYFQLSLSAVF